MRLVWIFMLSFFFAFSLSLLAQAGTPACVKRPEARAKLSLRVPAGQKKNRKSKSKSKSKSKRKPKPAKVKDDSIKLSQYTPLSWTGKQEGGWLEVKDMNGKNYWVRRRDLSFDMKCLSVQVQKSRLRSGPGDNFDRAPVAQKGDVFLDLGGEDGWTRVENAKGERAWINLDHIWRPSSKMRMVFEPEK
jgi:hypothetical protein